MLDDRASLTDRDGAAANIFEECFTKDRPFVDRYVNEGARAVDVIVPTHNTNGLWRANLLSYYREIPISRLLIGDGGCEDDTIAVVSEFPRVQVLDQRNFYSLGACLRDLMRAVETEWFVYLHSDVYLPPGWFDAMVAHRGDYDWFECRRRMVVLLEYPGVAHDAADRPYSGSQMGRKRVFDTILDRIDDDYLYRNEDLVFRELVEGAGGRYGRALDTWHYHEKTNKPGLQEPDLIEVSLKRAEDPAWQVRTYDSQARGIIKYTRPSKPYLIANVLGPLRRLDRLGALDKAEFRAWTEATRPEWLEYVLPVLEPPAEPHDRPRISAELGKIAASCRTIWSVLLRAVTGQKAGGGVNT